MSHRHRVVIGQAILVDASTIVQRLLASSPNHPERRSSLDRFGTPSYSVVHCGKPLQPLPSPCLGFEPYRSRRCDRVSRSRALARLRQRQPVQGCPNAESIDERLESRRSHQPSSAAWPIRRAADCEQSLSFLAARPTNPPTSQSVAQARAESSEADGLSNALKALETPKRPHLPGESPDN